MAAVVTATRQAHKSTPRWLPIVMMSLFAGVSLLGATLLFAVQPMVAKIILPSYGGSPMVWNTSMLFFQTALLAGYAYAHWSQRRLGARWQPVLQVVLTLPPFLVLPVLLPAWAASPGSVPAPLWLLLVLGAMVGAPFAVLATTSPTVQRWYSWSDLPRAHDPYFLFGASNTGSFVALLAYPFLIEPALDLSAQTRWWTAGYALFAAAMIACAVVVLLVRRSGRGLMEPVPVTGRPAGQAAGEADQPDEAPSAGLDDPAGDPEEAARTAGAASAGGDASAARPAARPAGEVRALGWRRRLTWIGLAFLPSSLMLGVTTHMSTDIAPVPLLWVVPLAAYLLTFIVAFSGTRQRRWLPWTVRAAGGLALLLPWGLGVLSSANSLAAIPLDLAALVAAGLACHGLLAADRPEPSRLTEFYLLVSVGGALGGLFNGLVAPIAFDWALEFPLSIAAMGLLPLLAGELSPLAARLGRWRQWASAAVLAAGPVVVIFLVTTTAKVSSVPAVAAALLWAWAVPHLARPRFLAAAAAVLVLGYFYQYTSGASVRERTFFGSYRVISAADRTTLTHGVTVHGSQLRDPAQRRTPTSYYSRSGPLGSAFTAYGPRRSLDRVAVVGLGAGTVAAYGRAGQQMDFYEIDPLVVRLARDARYFTYLRDCPCRNSMIVGDGRLKLAEAGHGTYGLIVLDAFSSDAVPVHMLTREAIRLYTSRLAPDGVLMFHVSNRGLDLAPMLGATARANGLSAFLAESNAGSDKIAESSSWVAVARTESDLQPLRAADGRWRRIPPGGPVWTDAYSSLFGVLR